MFENKSQIVTSIAGLLISSTYLLTSVPKANAGFFSVSPMVTISDAVSGQAKGAINVTNSGTEPLRLRIYAEDFTYNRNKGYLATPAHNRSAIPYLQFSPRELTIPPGVTRNVRVGISLPASSTDGEYRASVFVEELKEKKKVEPNATGTPIILNARVASIFFIGKGGAKPSLQGTSSTWNSKEKNITVLLTNQGKKSAYPVVKWKISQNGKEVTNGSVLGVVLQAETEREVTLRGKDKDLELPTGSYQLSGEIVNDGQKPVPFNVGVVVP